MSIATISDLAMGGLNGDLIPSVMNSNLLTYCKNVRSVSGGIAPFGGSSDMWSLPDMSTPYEMLYVNSATTKAWYIACGAKIFKLEANFADVTPTGMVDVGDGTRWSSTDLSGLPILNHPATGPLYMTEADAQMKSLPFDATRTWKQANQACDLIVSHKQFLFGLGVTNNGQYVPDSIRWSAPADIGGVPPTWDELDTTQVAGFTQLGGSGGSIVGAKPMRDALCIYRTNGITVVDYVGGRYVWRIRHLTSNAGLLSKDSVVDVNGTHYFISDGDVFKNDGNTIVSIADKRIKKRMQAINKDSYDTCFAVHNPRNMEILFCVPTVLSELPNIAYVYNYINNSWFARDIPECIKARYGIAIKQSNTWEDIKTNWDGWESSWDDDATTPFDNSVLAIVNPVVNPDDPTLNQPAKIIGLTSIIGLNTKPFSSIIERTDLKINNMDTTTTIQRVYPHIQGSTPVYIQIGSQQSPGGAISWKPPRLFDPGTDRKVDMRTTGILHCYRIYVDELDSSFTISGIDFQYVEAGHR